MEPDPTRPITASQTAPKRNPLLGGGLLGLRPHRPPPRILTLIDGFSHVGCRAACELKPRCTPEKVKRFKRWKHEAVLDAMQNRLDQLPDAMGLRRQTVEHVFGTLKSWAGSTPLLTRTLEKVRTEISLAVLAYNMKRVIKLLGVGPLLQAIRA